MLRVVAGKARGMKLSDVSKITTRPITSRIKTSLFDKIQSYFQNERILDLYAGTGSMGIEAISRGACHCTFVDMDADCVGIINENLNKTGFLNQAKVYCSSVERFLEGKNKEKFKFILYDPPFPIVESNYQNIMKEINLMKDWLDADAAVVFRYPRGTFQLIDGYEIINQKNYGISDISILTRVEEND